MVTYQSKLQSFYLMLYLVNVLDLKKIAQSKTNIKETSPTQISDWGYKDAKNEQHNYKTKTSIDR